MRVCLAVLAVLAISCSESTPPRSLNGLYELVSENGDPVPSDPFAPAGCCLTLSGSLSITLDTYQLHTWHFNKNSEVVFENSEVGTFVLTGNTLSFTRTGGGGAGFPYLLGPGTVSADGTTITLRYGDEGPGSNQISALFQKALQEE